MKYIPKETKERHTPPSYLVRLSCCLMAGSRVHLLSCQTQARHSHYHACVSAAHRAPDARGQLTNFHEAWAKNASILCRVWSKGLLRRRLHRLCGTSSIADAPSRPCGARRRECCSPTTRASRAAQVSVGSLVATPVEKAPSPSQWRGGRRLRHWSCRRRRRTRPTVLGLGPVSKPRLDAPR